MIPSTKAICDIFKDETKICAFFAVTLVTMHINATQSMKLYAWYRFESIQKDSRIFENHTQDKILWNDFDDYHHCRRNVYWAQKRVMVLFESISKVCR